MKSVIYLFVGLLLIFFSGCYTLREGSALIGLYSQARPIDEVLESPGLTEKEKTFLLSAKEIKKFALDTLGLRENKNYTTFVRTERKYLADVVSACDELRFNQYLWDYSFLGKMPYQGFFNPKDAQEEAARLKALGLDVMTRTVDAFSTLGWFSDPLFSYMTGYSEYRLANLLIHEQTHATIFLSNQGNFNENLASFVGNQGAVDFLKTKYGPQAPILKTIADSGADQETFRKKFQELYDELKDLYENPVVSTQTRRLAKAQIIESFQKRWLENYDKDFKTQGLKWVGTFGLNNALIMTYRNYTAGQGVFQKFYEESGNSLTEMIARLKKNSSSLTSQ